ncbi:hypothetical protein FRZ67_03175 [Panacibacter ginsenosidivorans]|uniref:Uncharacterized protein n=1 Tax=Panacibacter ginsenosidivorans TaxID=1813871 RepID=A0A5B8V569_9BACT|nr:hypothetical protein [Panacibacter ginsenosidivorans]QEC66352.1 hypothetical protein FRZ67_03175 [Panacibacter ginsenosidivorans]
MSDSKIQVKVGIVEFSGEGNQDWLAKQLDKILDKVPELLKIEVGDSTNKDNQNKGGGSGSSNVGGAGTISGLSVLNIAGKLSNKSGSDLVIIAAAFLHFVEGKTSFTRDDISTAMKKATGVYKDNYLSNLTKYLTQLEKNSTLLKSGTTYSLNANKVNELNAILSK